MTAIKSDAYPMPHAEALRVADRCNDFDEDGWLYVQEPINDRMSVVRVMDEDEETIGYL